MKSFEIPAIEVKLFEVEDILTASTPSETIDPGETLADYGIEDCGAAA